MPNPAFDAIVSQLGADDPAFVRRVRELDDPRRTARLALAVLLWTFAPLGIVLGGWTGTVLALVAGAYGAHLMRRREQPVAGSGDPAPHDRPGASL